MYMYTYIYGHRVTSLHNQTTQVTNPYPKHNSDLKHLHLDIYYFSDTGSFYLQQQRYQEYWNFIKSANKKIFNFENLQNNLRNDPAIKLQFVAHLFLQ